MRDRNIVLLKRIVKYSNEISGTITRFELDFDKLSNDYIARNAIAMCILQVGELAGHLTDEFKAAHNKVVWRDFIAVRNKSAHAYWTMDSEFLWDIATDRIPELKEYCESIIEEKEKREEERENNT